MRCDKCIALCSAIALKCTFSLSHTNHLRFACNKLHFIVCKLHLIFFIGIHICHWGGEFREEPPPGSAYFIHNTGSRFIILMRFQPAALLAALALVPACAKCQKIPNEHPDISLLPPLPPQPPTYPVGGCGGDGGAVIASR